MLSKPDEGEVQENLAATSEVAAPAMLEQNPASLMSRAVSSVRRILWLMDADSLRIVNDQAWTVKSAILEDAESSYRFSEKSAEKSNSVCSSCGATWNRIVNVLWKLITKEDTYVWTRPKLVTIVKGIPIFAPESVYEKRDRTNPLNIRHCNDCGNEWEKAKARYVWERESVEDYLDYVRYTASALQKGETDSTWLSAYHMERMKRLSGWVLPYRETVALLSKQYRYEKFSVSDKRWLKKFLNSVLGE